MTLPLFKFLLIFIASLSFHFLNVVSACGQCREDQRALLIALKQNVVYDDARSTKLRHWNSSTDDCCCWPGVTCKMGRVIGLDLSHEGISGRLENSSSLFDLQHLESLNLGYNMFNFTSIPSGFGKLFRLVHLNLAYTDFRGQIPAEISNLTSLTRLEELNLDGVTISARGDEWCHAISASLPNIKVLSLSNCTLSGPLDSSLLKLQSLSVIRLHGNNLSCPVPEFFSNFSHLTSLGLSTCNLHGKFPKEIFQISTLEAIDLSFNDFLHGTLPEFSHNMSLQTVELRITNFSGNLPDSIGNLRMLSRLNLSSCNFIGQIPFSFANLTRLITIDLSYNKFTGPLLDSHVKSLLNLTVINISGNSLSGRIPSSLFALPSLHSISLSKNQFSGQLPDFSNASLSLLKTLRLNSNNLQGHVPMSVFDLGKLCVLDLSSNNFSGTIHFNMFQKLETLSMLDLSYNSLSIDASGPTWSSFPMNISTLGLASCNLTMFPNLSNQSELNWLDLSNNQIHGIVPNWIWKVRSGSLFHLNLSCNYLDGIQEPYAFPGSLKFLDLHSNRIRGKIHMLPQFAYFIDLSSNYFSSSIPANIGSSLNFTIFFSLSDNRLTGPIPKSICNARNMEVLDLSNNYLTGTIPSCISEMIWLLRVLNLRNNNLSGPIPSTFSVGCKLKTLDFNGNSMEGIIPKCLANCNGLEILDLGNNNLIDRFPCFLKSISTLRVLVLRSNKFHGSIVCSNTTETWEMLQIIDLAHNSFSGELPASGSAKWKAMKMADKDAIKPKHSHLQFEVLPGVYYRDSITVTCKGLELTLKKILLVYTSIDLSSNKFNGTIPEEMGALTLLYVLNLSHNAFSGSIPLSLGKLHNLESLDLSRNKLSGTIPSLLASLNFLSYLNLSFNQLSGRIPSGNQFQTFLADSFLGNKGLCGFPLTPSCKEEKITPKDDVSDSEADGIDWNLLSAEIGFIVGFGIAVGPLMFCKRWRKFYFQIAEDIACKIFPLSVTRKWLSWMSSR